MKINQGITLILLSIIGIIVFNELGISNMVFYLIIGIAFWRLDLYWELGNMEEK